MSRDGPANAIVLTLYSRTGCHLCKDMQYALEHFRDELDFQLVVEDVDCDPEWQKRFGEKVPVLMAENTELCHYFLDEATLRRYLQVR